MYKITTLLDNAKELNNLKSDRELSKLLDVANITPYRKRGAVPSDDTAKKLADLTGIKYELVLASCHGAIAKKNEDKDAVKAWRNIFKLAQSMVFVLIFTASFLPYPTPSVANTTLERVTSECTILYIMRRAAHGFNIALVRLRHWFNPSTYYFYA